MKVLFRLLALIIFCCNPAFCSAESLSRWLAQAPKECTEEYDFELADGTFLAPNPKERIINSRNLNYLGEIKVSQALSAPKLKIIFNRIAIDNYNHALLDLNLLSSGATSIDQAIKSVQNIQAQANLDSSELKYVYEYSSQIVPVVIPEYGYQYYRSLTLKPIVVRVEVTEHDKLRCRNILIAGIFAPNPDNQVIARTIGISESSALKEYAGFDQDIVLTNLPADALSLASTTGISLDQAKPLPSQEYLRKLMLQGTWIYAPQNITDQLQTSLNPLPIGGVLFAGYQTLRVPSAQLFGRISYNRVMHPLAFRNSNYYYGNDLQQSQELKDRVWSNITYTYVGLGLYTLLFLIAGPVLFYVMPAKKRSLLWLIVPLTCLVSALIFYCAGQQILPNSPILQLVETRVGYAPWSEWNIGAEISVLATRDETIEINAPTQMTIIGQSNSYNSKQGAKQINWSRNDRTSQGRIEIEGSGYQTKFDLRGFSNQIKLPFTIDHHKLCASEPLADFYVLDHNLRSLSLNASIAKSECVELKPSSFNKHPQFYTVPNSVYENVYGHSQNQYSNLSSEQKEYYSALLEKIRAEGIIPKHYLVMFTSRGENSLSVKIRDSSITSKIHWIVAVPQDQSLMTVGGLDHGS
ncbi:hypothetical protein JNK13_07200 [bacterium]|nr:hypothetical protein [bacterium]